MDAKIIENAMLSCKFSEWATGGPDCARTCKIVSWCRCSWILGTRPAGSIWILAYVVGWGVRRLVSTLTLWPFGTVLVYIGSILCIVMSFHIFKTSAPRLSDHPYQPSFPHVLGRIKLPKRSPGSVLDPSWVTGSSKSGIIWSGSRHGIGFSQVVDLCMDHLHLAPNVRFLFSDKDALTNGNLAQTWPPGPRSPRSPRSPRPSRGPQHDHQGASLPFSIMFACVTFTHVSTCIYRHTDTNTHTHIHILYN